MKKIIEKTIFHEFDNKPIRFSAIKDIVEDNDIIYAGWEVMDDYYYMQVIREREETDEEYQERLEDEKKHIEQVEKRQYETYLKLKAKFEK